MPSYKTTNKKNKVSESTQSDSSDSTALGNTNSGLLNSKGSRAWSFTLNNPDSDSLTHLTQSFDVLNGKYVIGNEIGASGTPHYQGYVLFKNQIRIATLKNINNKIHWEESKADTAKNWIYCTKDGDILVDTITKQKSTFAQQLKMQIKSEYEIITWKPWQKLILDILTATKPDPRTIHWFWEPTGNVGKSFLMKYLCCEKGTIMCDGKKDNIFNQVFQMIYKEETEPKLVILDIPRVNEDYINYGVIEQLKNGCIYSGKFEGGLCVFHNPHIVIFANFYPDTSLMSKDRWIITEISE